MNTLRLQIHPDVHAYLLKGTWNDVGAELESAVTLALETKLSGNADVVRIDRDVFGIDDARFVTTFQSRRATIGGKKIIMLTCRSMTREAQNALLKVFEEPTPHTYFFLVTGIVRVLLPTLRSRLFELTHKIEERVSEHARTFLSSASSERLVFLEKIVHDKDTETARILLDEILSELYGGGIAAAGRAHTYALEEVIRARQCLGRRGSSLKLLLEHIALVIPPHRA